MKYKLVDWLEDDNKPSNIAGSWGLMIALYEGIEPPSSTKFAKLQQSANMKKPHHRGIYRGPGMLSAAQMREHAILNSDELNEYTSEYKVHTPTNYREQWENEVPDFWHSSRYSLNFND